MVTWESERNIRVIGIGLFAAALKVRAHLLHLIAPNVEHDCTEGERAGRDRCRGTEFEYGIDKPFFAKNNEN
jgi:hypothetical protein